MSGYLLDNQQPEAGSRFEALSALFDPVTHRHLIALGITSGWRCWEVGAGGPRLAQWLWEQTGSVLATDIDISWMPPEAPYDIRLHDVGREPAPDTGFDLIHARLVLVHVPQRDEALRSLVSALRPGGWLLIEDADPALQPLACPDEYDDASALANRLRKGFRALMADRGVDLSYGRTLPRRLREAGLVDVRADGFFPLTAPECRALEAATVLHIRDRLLDTGLATEDEIAQHLSNLRTSQLDVTTAPLISAWGRKPQS